MIQPASFASSVDQIKAGFAKGAVTLLYLPLVVGYYNFRVALETAHEKDSLEAYLEALTEFSHSGVRETIHERVVEISKLLLEDDTGFFDAHYPNLSAIARRHQPKSEHLQQLRSKLFSFFQVINNDLAEMRNEWIQIENRLERVGDTTSQLRSGMTGGVLGAAVGSIVPVVGTAIGAVLGGYLMDRHRQSGEQEQIMSCIQNYVMRTESLTDKLGQNARELYMIFDGLAETLYRRIPRRIYQDLKEEGHNADLIMLHYYEHCHSEIFGSFEAKMDEDDPASPTFRDMITLVHNFIQQCRAV